jgi:hypothetical protein
MTVMERLVAALMPFASPPPVPSKPHPNAKRAATIRERNKARQDEMTMRLRAEIEAARKA